MLRRRSGFVSDGKSELRQDFLVLMNLFDAVEEYDVVH